MDTGSELKDSTFGPMKTVVLGPSEYILGDALDVVPDDNLGTLSSEDLKGSMSKWCLNPKEDDKSALSELVAQIMNEGNCSKWFKQEDTIKQEEPDDVKYPCESYIPSTCKTQDQVSFVKEEPDDVTYPCESYIPNTYATRNLVPFVKNFKSLQCTSQVADSKRITRLRHSSVYKNSTSLPKDNSPINYSLPNELTCRYCLNVFKTKKDFRSHTQLGCKSYLMEALEINKIQNFKSKVQKKVNVKQDKLINSTVHDVHRRLAVPSFNSKEQEAINFSQQNTHAWKQQKETEDINKTGLEKSTKVGKGCKNSYEQFLYSIENINNSPQCNNSERNSPLNKCKSVEAVTSSLPEEKSKSEETTTEVVWTDGECSSDDNRQEELFDSYDSCSGDIFCKCIRCRKKHCDNSPKAKYKNIYAFPCDLCNKVCRRPFELKTHKESKCGSLKLFNCEVCCRGFTTKPSLKDHINTVHCVEKPFKCDICQAKFPTKNRLGKHVLRVHKKNKSISLCLTCEFCNKVLSSRKSLRIHISTWHSEDKFICAHCSKVLNSKNSLLEHIQTKHLRRDVFKCTKCPRFFVTEKGLQNHFTQNCSPKKCVCEFCAKTCKDSTALKKHLLIHTGQKSFVCDTCGKCFRTESNLYQHSVTHSDKRPFTCDVCDKSFRIKHHLRQHMAVHGMVNTSNPRNRKKNLKSLQCTLQTADSNRNTSLRHSIVYKNATSLPKNNSPNSLPNELACRYCLKVFKSKTDFRSHTKLLCKSYLKKDIEKDKIQIFKSKVQKKVKGKQDNLLNNTVHDFSRRVSMLNINLKKQEAIHFSRQNTNGLKQQQETQTFNNIHLKRSTRSVITCVYGNRCKHSDKQFSYSVENKKNSLQCNSIERSSPLNECKSVEAVTSSLPEEKSKSEETTTEVVWTDDECSSDDNRQEELFDSSDSCSGDIFCKCIRCRKSHIDDSNKAKSKNIYAFPCDLCNKRFSRPYKLKAHKDSKCGSLKLFNCEVCCRGFTTKFSLKDHINTVHCVEKPFTCDICQAKLPTKNRLIKHVSIVHKNKSITLCQTCEFCKKVFSSRVTLLRHISTFHKEEKFICAHCSKVLNSKQYLLHHIKKKHLIQDMFKCRKCSKSFVTEKGLQNHLSQNCLIKKFFCEICAKTFKHNLNLKHHLLIHTGNKSFVCDTCGKCFRTESNLYQHSVTHSDKRPFTCDVCDKSFRIKHHLRQHMAVHGMVNTSSARNRKK